MFHELFDKSEIVFSRHWSMPTSETFSMPPVIDFVSRWKQGKAIDPFARRSKIACVTNDLNPDMGADFSLDAETFVRTQDTFDTVLFDPPYSPRQISECYNRIGLDCGTKETQNATLYARVRNAIDEILLPGGIVLSFGWSTNGMGKTRKYEIVEIMLVAHGGAHNDTICMAEIKR